MSTCVLNLIPNKKPRSQNNKNAVIISVSYRKLLTCSFTCSNAYAVGCNGGYEIAARNDDDAFAYRLAHYNNALALGGSGLHNYDCYKRFGAV